MNNWHPHISYIYPHISYIYHTYPTYTTRRFENDCVMSFSHRYRTHFYFSRYFQIWQHQFRNNVPCEGETYNLVQCFDARTIRTKKGGKYRVFQKDLSIFYSGHRGHRTWHPVIFSYGDTLKTMPTIHHFPKMCVNCKIAFELRCKPLMGTCWSACGRRVSYWHLQSNEGRSHRAFVSWFW